MKRNHRGAFPRSFTMKRCSICNESKELICFYKNKSKTNGFTSDCKECNAEKRRKYKESNPEYQRKYHKENAKKLAEKRREYLKVNAEKIAEYQRKYRQSNAEKFAERDRKYRQSNAEKIAERERKYQQAQKQEQSANLFFQMAHFASEITKTTITP